MEVGQRSRTETTTSTAPRTSLQGETVHSYHPIIPDCLEHVLKFLNTSDKGRSARVCRLWRDTCYRRSVWRGTTASVQLDSNARVENTLHSIHTRGIRKLRVRSHRNNLDAITRVFRTLQSLDIGGCYYTTDENLTKAFQAPQQMSELKELSVAFCEPITDSSLATALEKCPNLESLNLQGCTNLRLADPLVKRSLRKCTRLKALNLQGCKQVGARTLADLFATEEGEGETNQGEGEWPISLRELSLKDCDSVCDTCLQHLCPYLTSLETLDLSFCISVSDRSLMAVADNLHLLQHLYLRAVDHICCDGIRHVASKCTKLKSLDLGFCEKIFDDCLEVISESPLTNSLEVLDVSCAKITDEGILALSQSLQRLKHLKIGQCDSLTDASLLHISGFLSKLVTIDVYGCGFSCRAISSIWDTLPDLERVDNNILQDDGE